MASGDWENNDKGSNITARERRNLYIK